MHRRVLTQLEARLKTSILESVSLAWSQWSRNEARAYPRDDEQVLFSTTHENHQRFGNPDGYHGRSVMIGLPAWPTNKDIELSIFVAYDLVIIMHVHARTP